MTDRRLQRTQWAVRATLVLGVAASVTANILHAKPNPVSQTIAAWPPMALLITVELVTRIPVHHRALGVIRIVAASTIATIAAWISYHHMVGVVARYGETGTVPYLLPLSVDGLIIVASVSLVELAARRRKAEHPPRVVAAKTPPAPSPGQPIASPIEPTPEINDTRPPGRSPRSKLPLLDVDTSQPAQRTTPDAAEHRNDDQGTDGSETHRDLAAQPDDYETANETDVDLGPDLVPLLAAARAARDELTSEGHTVSRDALARRLRQNGHSIRNSAVSQLLVTLRQETQPVNGTRTAAPV
ncbi:DUF2637 domain-containing protein [Plantactinospora siamensis]|uniref:DUF2637 domain-containing protein n=1 Tax=Plantactinospora siamensis TaxID=555372 RepID=A0ABV6NU65_9ACTN